MNETHRQSVRLKNLNLSRRNISAVALADILPVYTALESVNPNSKSRGTHNEGD